MCAISLRNACITDTDCIPEGSVVYIRGRHSNSRGRKWPRGPHLATPGTARTNCAQKCKFKSALLLFTLHFSFVVVKPIQSKQVEVSVLHLASYLCLHHMRLYYFSTYCTHENSMMAFMPTCKHLPLAVHSDSVHSGAPIHR